MLFFFFKQKTAYEMRISDWSSDVCSSDLAEYQRPHRRKLSDPQQHVARPRLAALHERTVARHHPQPERRQDQEHAELVVHHRVDRKSVVSGKSVSVRVDLGGRRIIKKKNNNTSDMKLQKNEI